PAPRGAPPLPPPARGSQRRVRTTGSARAPGLDPPRHRQPVHRAAGAQAHSPSRRRPARSSGGAGSRLGRFWGTSALVPLFIAERESGTAVRCLREDPEVVVWTLARVEMLAALARRSHGEPAAARPLTLVRRDFLDAWERGPEGLD